MDKRDFEEIRKLIRAVWYGSIESLDEISAWYQTFKRYEYDDVKAAVERYIMIGKYVPKPADIIEQIPSSRSDSKFCKVPVYHVGRNSSGKEIKVREYLCKRCKDSGMITFDDKDGYTYGKPCDCAAGHYYFKWGWLTEEEQKEYVNRFGHHGEVIGENWRTI